MQEIDREKVKELIESRDDLVLVEVLAEGQFKKLHLPGAINVPVDENFETAIQEKVPDKSAPVVAYCYDEDCPASGKAARKMDALGYEEVYNYVGGKMDWKEAGEEIEGIGHEAR